MAYSAPPARTEISDTYPNPSNAVARVGFGKLWDYVTGLLGATGSPTAAKAALLVPQDVDFTNRIINGAMMIDQRNAGAIFTGITSATYTIDRWRASNNTGTARYTVQQNSGTVTPPDGFKNYLGAVSLGSYSVGSGDIFYLNQTIEGYNVADLGWGAAGAASVTLSFWVRSSLTGTFGGALQNSGSTRSYPYTYTINAANTWEQKTVTIAGDTSGTWLTVNGVGVTITFGLGCGSTYSGTAGTWAGADYRSATGATSVVGTSGATFYVTGVQLEKGTAATGFAYRPYGTELALCQRYYQQLPSVRDGSTLVIANYMFGSSDRIPLPVLPVQMRAIPTITSYRVGGTASGETTEFSASTNRVVTSIPSRDACGGGYFQCSTAFSNPAQLNVTISAEL